MTNKCLKCGKDKTLVGKKSPILVCIDCKGAARRERYKNDEEYRNKRKASMKGYAPKWRKKHPEKAMLASGQPSELIVELEKVLHDMADDYEDRTDECLLSLAIKHINKNG